MANPAEGHVIIDSMPAGGAGLTDSELRAAAVHVVVDAAPAATIDTTGLATVTKQDTGNASLASLDGKLPALVGGRIPVVLPAGGGGLTDTELRAAPVPVSGTVAATGTFWQATQPVSGPLTDAQLRALAVPVSGSFYQATQPVSIAATVAVSGPLTDVQLRTTALPVSAAALPLPAGASTEATLALIKAKTDNIDVALSTRAVTGLTDAQIRATALPVSGTFYQATQPVSAAALPLPTGAATAALQAIPTLTKGTQGATGYSTQDLKDSGRVLKTYTVSALACVTAEALISLTPYADLVAGTPATTHAVTSGKRLRIQRISITVRATSTVNVGGIVRLRLLAGTVLVGSPVHGSIGCMASVLATAVAGNAQSFELAIPDGLELSGTMQFGLTQLFSAITATIDVHVTGFEY